jgi:hypothetical protein
VPRQTGLIAPKRFSGCLPRAGSLKSQKQPENRLSRFQAAFLYAARAGSLKADCAIIALSPQSAKDAP